MDDMEHGRRGINMSLARSNGGYSHNGDSSASSVPDEIEICAEDFDRVFEWQSKQQAPTKAAIEANQLFYQLLNS